MIGARLAAGLVGKGELKTGAEEDGKSAPFRDGVLELCNVKRGDQNR